MLLKIGELSKRTGLTVRALHHYDAIGLLTPTARTDAGYRLYNRHDIARLHQIQALRKFGLTLADIATYLARPDLPFSRVIGEQIAQLTRQIEQATTLRSRLHDLQQQLQQGQQPELADWLTTLELMTMYDQYFSQEELKQLPLYQAGDTVKQEWKTLVANVAALMASGTGPEHPQAIELASQWMRMVVRDTGARPQLFAKLNRMHEQQQLVQEQSGISPDMMRYVLAASRQRKLAIYRNYLEDDEFAFLSANLDRRASEWPPLIAQVQDAIDQGVSPAAPSVRPLALQWLELFRSFAGDNPATQQKVRLALQNEPALTDSGFVNAAMRDFMRAAITSLQTGAAASVTC